MKINEELQQRLLQHISGDNYQPVKPRVIAKQLSIADDDLRDLKRALKRLAKKGQIVFGPNHLVLKAGSPAAPRNEKRGARPGEVVGRFSRAAAGYGFVTPLPSGSATESTRKAYPEDIYIPQSRTLDAARGDLVRVLVTSHRRGPAMRLSGEVTEVIERRTHRFVGTYLERGKAGVVSIDGNQFDADVLVGDASARTARVGDKVIIEMVRFPGHQRHGAVRQGEAVILEVLGDRGKPGVDTLMVIAEFGLPGEFPEAALSDAHAEAEKFDESLSGNRTDFTGETVVTIDPKTARDFDDAISLKKIANGHWELGVHIADVSHFVRPNTELDNEAFRRATSVYLPDRVIPMLPEVISNNLASLQPDRVRYTMSAIIEFTADGAPVATQLHRSAIRSRHRFNYEEIDEYLADDRPWKSRLAPDVFRLVRDMHSLAMILRKRRMERGSLDLIIPEVEIDLDENGRVCGAHTREHTESHQVIEEFMLAANEAVARTIADMHLHLLRRIHLPPSPIKLSDLGNLLTDLGYNVKNIQDRFQLKQIIEASRNSPDGFAVHYAILRAMQKAIYSPQDAGHYALASEAYCHFTSPIRRYPDLIIHRMVGAIVDGKKPASNFGLLQRLGVHCSELEQRAEQAERELIKLKLVNFLHSRIGYEMDAVITGVEQFGLFAQGVELPASGIIPRESLPEDRYRYDRSTRTLQGHRPNSTFRLGNKLRVRVVSADPDRREIEFALVGRDRGDSRSTGSRTHGRPAAQRKKADTESASPQNRKRSKPIPRTAGQRKGIGARPAKKKQGSTRLGSAKKMQRPPGKRKKR